VVKIISSKGAGKFAMIVECKLNEMIKSDKIMLKPNQAVQFKDVNLVRISRPTDGRDDSGPGMKKLLVSIVHA
jgi:hypothetical protein